MGNFVLVGMAKSSDDENETSCGAAVRAKPKARLCEPWEPSDGFVPSPGAGERSNQSVNFRVTLVAIAASRLDVIERACYPRLAKPRLGPELLPLLRSLRRRTMNIRPPSRSQQHKITPLPPKGYELLPDGADRWTTLNDNNSPSLTRISTFCTLLKS